MILKVLSNPNHSMILGFTILERVALASRQFQREYLFFFQVCFTSLLFEGI